MTIKQIASLRIKIFFYGFNIQTVRCDTCQVVIGYNIGCNVKGVSHGKCQTCFDTVIKKYKGR